MTSSDDATQTAKGWSTAKGKLLQPGSGLSRAAGSEPLSGSLDCALCVVPGLEADRLEHDSERRLSGGGELGMGGGRVIGEPKLDTPLLTESRKRKQ